MLICRDTLYRALNRQSSSPALPGRCSRLYTAQFSAFNPRARRNSRSLFVTSVNSAPLACTAIHKSLFQLVNHENHAASGQAIG
jgi:hypothetical protein